MRRLAAAAFLAGIIAAAPRGCLAAGLQLLARDLALAAQQARISRVAVLPFVPADATSPAPGRLIAERLLTDLVRERRVTAVERSLLDKLLEEKGVLAGRIAEPSARRAAGLALRVDGLVTGGFLARGGNILVWARLIETETGLIVATGERTVSRAWLGLSEAGLAQAGQEATPEYCVGADEQVDRIESDILDLKARYWALQLRRGASLSALRVFPGAAISNLELRQSLYDRMHDWYALGKIPELSPGELSRLLTLDRRAFLLHRGCLRPEGG